VGFLKPFLSDAGVKFLENGAVGLAKLYNMSVNHWNK